MSKKIHQDNWDEIIRLVKSDFCKDIHKMYDPKGGWVNLTDKYGVVHEIRWGMPVTRFKSIVSTIKTTNNFESKGGRRAYRNRPTPPINPDKLNPDQFGNW